MTSTASAGRVDEVYAYQRALLDSAAATGTLGTYVSMTVEVGTVGAFAGCGAFSASSTAINGIALATVGTKTNYSTGYSSGWSPAAGESRVFKFTYTLSASTPDARRPAGNGLHHAVHVGDTDHLMISGHGRVLGRQQATPALDHGLDRFGPYFRE